MPALLNLLGFVMIGCVAGSCPAADANLEPGTWSSSECVRLRGAEYTAEQSGAPHGLCSGCNSYYMALGFPIGFFFFFFLLFKAQLIILFIRSD